MVIVPSAAIIIEELDIMRNIVFRTQIDKSEYSRVRTQKQKKLDELVQQWAQGIDVTESISCEGKTIKGEMKNPVKQRIKAFLLEEQNHRCCICGQVDSWNNQPLDFILDHIDGNPYNHLKTNLRLVCPHCESQLPTHGGRNRGHGRFSVRYQYNRYNNINN